MLNEIKFYSRLYFSKVNTMQFISSIGYNLLSHVLVIDIERQLFETSETLETLRESNLSHQKFEL